MKKRIAAVILVGMLAVSGASFPCRTGWTAYASASYSDAQTETYAMQVAGMVNRERAANGLAPLKYSDKLSEAALVRAEEIQSVCSHTRPNGTRCFTAVTEAGINYTSAGENIAYGQRNPEEVMNAWMNSSGHRANILGAYDYIGVGVTYKNGTYYWSQFFAVSKDLSGKVITLGDETTTTKATTATTAPTSKATAKATTKAATAPTSEATTAPTSKATAKATTKATTAPTSKATSKTTKPSASVTNANPGCSGDASKDCGCGRKEALKKLLMSMLGLQK